MLYIVEIPIEDPAQVWVARDGAEFISRVRARRNRLQGGGTIHKRATAREMLWPDTPGNADRKLRAAEFALAAEHGWDTPLTLTQYRDAGGTRETQLDLTEFEACCHYLGGTLRILHVFKTERDAIRGLQELIEDHRAAYLLTEKLIEAGAMVGERTSSAAAVDRQLDERAVQRGDRDEAPSQDPAALQPSRSRT